MAVVRFIFRCVVATLLLVGRLAVLGGSYVSQRVMPFPVVRLALFGMKHALIILVSQLSHKPLRADTVFSAELPRLRLNQ